MRRNKQTDTNKLDSGIGDKTEISRNGTQSDTLMDKRVFTYLILLVHASVVGFTIFILYLSFKDTVVLFSWHPALTTCGFMLLMTEAILILTNDNLVLSSFSYKFRVRLHWIIQAVGVVLSVTGYIIIVVNKNNDNSKHFQTYHAIVGLISCICLLLTSIGGVAALFSFDLRNYISPVLIKLLHSLAGIGTFIFGSITLILALYSNWFLRNSSTAGQVIGIIIICFAAFITLFKPLKTVFQRISRMHF